MKLNLRLPFLFIAISFAFSISSLAQGWVGNSQVNPNVLYGVNASTALSPLNVGIGTNAPSAQFHTTGSVRFAGITNDNTQSRVIVQDGTGNLYYRDVSTLGSAGGWLTNGNNIGNTEFIGTLNSQDFRINTNNTQRMVISSIGNIAVNTPVNTMGKFVVFNGGAMDANEDQHVIAVGNSPSFTLSNIIYTPGTTINGTSPYAKIGLATRNTAFTNAAVPGDMVLANYNSNAIIFCTETRQNYNASPKTYNDEKMRISGNGNVGIGTRTPSATLDVFGTLRFENLQTCSNCTPLVISSSGYIYMSGPGTRNIVQAGAKSSDDVESLKQEVTILKNELDIMKNQIALLSLNKINSNAEMPYLISNSPNPFNSNTIINYSLPSTFSNSSSYINISDASGNVLKKYRIQYTGKGNVNISELANLSSGVYFYSLEIDGKIYDSKKMILSK